MTGLARHGEQMTFDKHPKGVRVKGLGDWRYRYDLKTGTFDVPAVFAKENAEALKWEIR